MSCSEVSYLLPGGKRFHRVRPSWESVDEFRARVICEVEDKITGRRNGGPAPAGTQIAKWEHDGYPIGRFHRHAFGAVLQSTGRPYVDRWEVVGRMADHSTRLPVLP